MFYCLRYCFWICSILLVLCEANATYFYRNQDALIAVPAQSSGVQADDRKLIERLVKAYRLSASSNENRGDSIWQLFFDQRHASLHLAFLQGSFDQVAAILRNPAGSDLFYGFDNLAKSLLPGFAPPNAAQNYAALCLDRMVRFAEVLGAVSLYNPEWPLDVKWNTNSIVQMINQQIGISLLFPNPYPNEYGVCSSYGIISDRVPQALYQAYRIKQLLSKKPNPKVLEIGGGLGRTAFYARQMGIQDYTILDLPFTAISSGYFLGRVLGGDQILFHGETATDPENCIKMITPNEFLSGYQQYDLIISADGFTELDPSVAKIYWNKIEESTPLFLSINHERNPFKVKSLIDQSTKIIQSNRFPYWMRAGYVEEVVSFQTNP